MPRRPRSAYTQYGDHDAPTAEERDAVATTLVPGDNPLPAVAPVEVMPYDAMSLKEVIDRRFKHLLSTAMEPQHMTKALEAATKWYEASTDKGEQWGKNLPGSTSLG